MEHHDVEQGGTERGESGGIPDLDRIAVAMNAYPFESGWFATWTRPPRYCAIGQLLRYAGVEVEDIRRINGDMLGGWRHHRELLRREYGIADRWTYWTILYAADGSDTQDDAVTNVRLALSGGPLDGICEPWAGMIAHIREHQRKGG
ncbi:MAG TPA: hypothetical protein VFS05_11725 [Gemmatimonadaceae bacterium]|nr:hypothetical protein [Gemmatimonadaceae bacterium]